MKSVVRTSAASQADNGIEKRFIGPLFSKIISDEDSQEKPTFLIENFRVGGIAENVFVPNFGIACLHTAPGAHRHIRLYIVSRYQSINETTDCSLLEILRFWKLHFRTTREY